MAKLLLAMFVGATLSLPSACFARPKLAASPRAAAHLHWSDAVSIESPDRKRVVRVQPPPDGAVDVGADEGATVTLVHTPTGATQIMFRLERDAWVHWSPDGSVVVVEDYESAENGRVLLFDLIEKEQGATTEALDDLIRAEVTRDLGPREEVLFNFPHVVAWAGTKLVIAGAMTAGVVNEPPARGRCLGFEVTIHPVRIVRKLDERDLRRRYGDVCRFYG